MQSPFSWVQVDRWSWGKDFLSWLQKPADSWRVQFTLQLCTRINSLRDSDDRIGRLFVLQGDSRADYHTSLFIDLGVYTRNRSFRLPFSSKAGKTALLLPTRRFRCSNLVSPYYKLYLKNFIIPWILLNSHWDLTFLWVDFVISFGVQGEYQVFMDSLICRLDQGCLKLLTFGNEVRSMYSFDVAYVQGVDLVKMWSSY